MANSFNISVAAELAALDTKVDANKAVVDAIRAVDIPALVVEIDANEVKIDTAIANIATVGGTVDAIKLKTDATPQKVRGKLHKAQLTTANAAFVTLCDISGQGIVRNIFVISDAADNIEVKLTIDTRVISGTFNGTRYLSCAPSYPNNDTFQLDQLTQPIDVNIFLEFDSAFKIEIRRSAGTTDDVHCKVFYTLDNF